MAIFLFWVKIAPPQPDVISLFPLKEITPISPIVPVCFFFFLSPYIYPKPFAASLNLKILFFLHSLKRTRILERFPQICATIIALIAFVPDFKSYGVDIDGGSVPVLPFYPDVPTVDHGFSRWFLNDEGFAILEDLQYN